MAQTASRPDKGGAAARSIRNANRGSVLLALALSACSVSGEAQAEGLQVTSEYYAGGGTTTFTWLRPGDRRITHLREPAPRNNCPALAFEILNPGRGEPRCVGYVPPYFPE
jgi:hypothetical protein